MNTGKTTLTLGSVLLIAINTAAGNLVTGWTPIASTVNRLTKIAVELRKLAP